MRREWTLRRELRVFFFGQTAILLLAFSALLPFFFDRGGATAAGLLLELQARDYDRRRSIDPGAPLPMSSSLDAYIGAENLPARMMERFPAGTHRNRYLQELELASDAVEDEDLVLFFPYDLADGQRLYLIQQVPAGATEDSVPVTHLNALIALVWSVGLGALNSRVRDNRLGPAPDRQRDGSAVAVGTYVDLGSPGIHPSGIRVPGTQ